jgi:hypothetical protein
MSKDARMRPEVLKAGYPHLSQFLSIVRKYNPGGKIRSVQSDRLGLTSGINIRAAHTGEPVNP